MTCRTGQCITPCDKCYGEPQPDTKCHGCGAVGYLAEMHQSVTDDWYCQSCWDGLPYFSNCCGVEARGVDTDMGICRDCHEHCEYVR